MSTFSAPPPSSSGWIPPLGASKAAAGICAAVFLLGAIFAIKDFRMTNRYRMSLIFGIGAASKWSSAITYCYATSC
jgi:membrane associated rhomboid family serine protease